MTREWRLDAMAKSKQDIHDVIHSITLKGTARLPANARNKLPQRASANTEDVCKTGVKSIDFSIVLRG